MSDGLSLLAVDDERPALEDLVRMLRASPLVARVDGAASAAEALVALGDGGAAYDGCSSTCACRASTGSSSRACCAASSARRRSCS